MAQETFWRVRGQYLGHEPIKYKSGDAIPDFFQMYLLTGQEVTRLSFSTKQKDGTPTAIGKQLEVLGLANGDKVVCDLQQPHARVWAPEGREAKGQLSLTALGIAREVPAGQLQPSIAATVPNGNGKTAVPAGART